MSTESIHQLEFVFTVGHIEVYKEKDQEAYYWRFFGDETFHGAFMSLQTCMSNYENVILSQQGMAEALEKSTQELTNQPGVVSLGVDMPATPVCPVVEANKPYNNVIFVDFYSRRRAF